jgi:hypothetical protein
LQRLGIVPTQIVNFRVSDARPAVGQTITFTGCLQWHVWPCVGGGIDGVLVNLLKDEVKVGDDYTEGGGWFEIQWSADRVGTYRFKAGFDGTWNWMPCSSQEITVTVLTPEQKAEEERRFWLMIAGAAGGVCVAALIGVGLYLEHERRMRMLAMVAARRGKA